MPASEGVLPSAFDRAGVMLPTTEVVGFLPQWGFGPRLGNSQAGCTTSHGPMVRRLPLLHHGAVGGLAYTALIAGEPRGRHLGSEQGISHPPCGGQHRMYPASTGRFGTSLLSPMGAASVNGSRVRGRTTAARANGPVWTERTTMRQSLKHHKCTDPKPTNGQRAVAESASNALSPTPAAVGFRAALL